MRFEVCRYARPESISKRAPSTTRTSLRVFESAGYGRAAEPETRIVIGIVIHLPIFCDHLRAFARSNKLGVYRGFFKRGLGRAGASRAAWNAAQRSGSRTKPHLSGNASASHTLYASAARLLVLATASRLLYNGG